MKIASIPYVTLFTLCPVLLSTAQAHGAGTNRGLDLLDQKRGKFIHYHHNTSDPSSLSHNRVRALYEDREGTLWIGTGMHWDTYSKGGLKLSLSYDIVKVHGGELKVKTKEGEGSEFTISITT